jgi:hypothetical protein
VLFLNRLFCFFSLPRQQKGVNNKNKIAEGNLKKKKLQEVMQNSYTLQGA